MSLRLSLQTFVANNSANHCNKYLPSCLLRWWRWRGRGTSGRRGWGRSRWTIRSSRVHTVTGRLLLLLLVANLRTISCLRLSRSWEQSWTVCTTWGHSWLLSRAIVRGIIALRWWRVAILIGARRGVAVVLWARAFPIATTVLVSATTTSSHSATATSSPSPPTRRESATNATSSSTAVATISIISATASACQLATVPVPLSCYGEKKQQNWIVCMYNTCSKFNTCKKSTNG